MHSFLSLLRTLPRLLGHPPTYSILQEADVAELNAVADYVEALYERDQEFASLFSELQKKKSQDVDDPKIH